MSAEVELRALDLFERLLSYPGNERFRRRLLKNEQPAVLDRLARLEAGHAVRAAMPTEMPDWMAAPLVEPPGQIGPFRLTERIGLGGMGDVWRGERNDGLFDQTVAIKLIQGHLGPDAAQAFEAERRILAKLDHPNIVRLIDGGITDDGLPYLIMDHVDGLAFDAAMASLELQARVALFLAAVHAVQFAHGRLIAHADLKPSNILVDTDGRVRLLDFGIASLLEHEEQRTTPAGAMTRAYASPERMAGAAPSIQDDVFALGRLLELAIADLDDDLAAIRAKATASQTERYATASDLAADIMRWQNGLPVSARPDTATYRTRKFIARHRLGVLASALALVAILGTSVFATLSSIRAERARAEATARFEDARGTARYLLFTLMDRLEAQPQSLALRKEVADVAQHYLDRLSNAANADPEVRLEAARGLIRLAEAQGVPGHPNLADPERAKHSLARALQLARFSSEPAARSIAVQALSYQARLASLVDHQPQPALQALDQAETISALPPALPALLQARLLNERAVAMGMKDEYAQVILLGKRALAVLAPTPRLDVLLERARAADAVAEGIYYAQSPQESLAPYRAALANYEEAHRRFPASRTVMERMERARWGLASTLLSMNRNVEALALLDDGHARVSKLVAFDADDLEAARLLQIVGLDRAQATADVGQFDRAIALYEANIAGRRAWLARNPGENRRLRDLAVAIKSLGDVQVRGGRIRQACATYEDFKALVAQLGKRGNLAEMDMDYTLKHLEQDERQHCR